MAPRRVIYHTPPGDDARGTYSFVHSYENNINENPYAHRVESPGYYPTIGIFLIASCLSAIILYSARCLFRNLAVSMCSVWFLSLVLPMFCVSALYLYQLLNLNECPWFKFRSVYFCLKSCIYQLRRSKFVFIRNLARLAELFTHALSFCHRFSPVVFPGILSPCLPFLVHLRSSSLLHHFAISLSALAPSPVLLNKVFRSPSDMFLYNMMRVSENSVESCFWSLSDAKMGALLSQTLVGLDSNPEKNEELVLTIYRAIPDLKLASAIQQFGSVLWNSDSPSELSVVFQVVGKEQGLDDFESCLLASKLWLEKHTGRFPNLITHWAESHCDSMELLYEYDKVLRLGDYGLDSFKDLQRKGPFPLRIGLRILKLAQKGLTDGRYYRGTFQVISDLIFDSEERNTLIEDVQIQKLILSIFGEAENFLGRSIEYRCRQAQVCARELEDFVRGIPYQMNDLAYTSSFYGEVVSFGNSALLIARGSLP